MIKKLLSVVLCASILWTSSNSLDAASAAGEVFATPSNLPQFQLVPPYQLGRIVDYFNASDGGARSAVSAHRLVVIIQDLHAHYGVQKNIAAILDFLSTKLPVANRDPRTALPFALAVEGAEGPIDSSVMALFPDKKIKDAASDYLMREGELAGAEYFAIERGLPNLLIGVENERYYNIHRDLFRKTFADRQALVKTLQNLQHDFQSLPRRTYSPAVFKLQGQVEAFGKGEIGLEELIKTLLSPNGGIVRAGFKPARSADPTNAPVNAPVDLATEFPTLAAYIKNARIGPGSAPLGGETLRTATAEFITASRNYLSAEEKKNIAVLAKGQGQQAYYLYLRELIEKHKLFLAVPPELAQYLEYLHIAQGSGMDRIIHETKELAFRVEMQFAQSQQEKDVLQVRHDLGLLVRLTDLQASETEVRAFAPRLNQFVALTKALVGQPTHESHFDETSLRRLISSSIDYYVMAMLRNQPMVENTLQLMGLPTAGNPQRQRVVAHKKEFHSPTVRISRRLGPPAVQATRRFPQTAVLVAGGFHTAPITELLREKNVSYLVIAPAVDKLTDADHDLYLKRLNGELLTPEEIFASLDPKPDASSRLARLWNFRKNQEGLAAGIYGQVTSRQWLWRAAALFATAGAAYAGYHNGHDISQVVSQFIQHFPQIQQFSAGQEWQAETLRYAAGGLLATTLTPKIRELLQGNPSPGEVEARLRKFHSGTMLGLAHEMETAKQAFDNASAVPERTAAFQKMSELVAQMQTALKAMTDLASGNGKGAGQRVLREHSTWTRAAEGLLTKAQQTYEDAKLQSVRPKTRTQSATAGSERKPFPPSGPTSSLGLPDVKTSAELRGPKEKGVFDRDDTINANGREIEFRWEHEKLHDDAKFREIIEQNVAKLRAAGIEVPIVSKFSKPGLPWYDLQGAMQNALDAGLATIEDTAAGPRVILVKSIGVDMRLEPDDIVALLDTRFAGFDHAGRSGEVFAADENKMWHELTELRLIADWFVRKARLLGLTPELVTTEIYEGRLGLLVWRLLNGQLDDSRISFYQSFKRIAHAQGIEAETQTDRRILASPKVMFGVKRESAPENRGPYNIYRQRLGAKKEKDSVIAGDNASLSVQTPRKPLAGNDFDRTQARRWVQAQATKRLRRTAQFFVDHLRHISQAEFESAVQKSVRSFNGTPHGRWALLSHTGYRADWSAQIAAEQGLPKPAETFNVVGNGKIEQGLNADPDLNDLVLAYDYDANGNNIVTLLLSALDGNQVNRRIRVHLVVPYLSRTALATITGSMPSNIEIIPHVAEWVPTLADQAEQAGVNAGDLAFFNPALDRQEVLADLGLFYFDHRNPLLNFLTEGLVFDEHGGQIDDPLSFIPAIEDVTETDIDRSDYRREHTLSLLSQPGQSETVARALSIARKHYPRTSDPGADVITYTESHLIPTLLPYIGWSPEARIIVIAMARAVGRFGSSTQVDRLSDKLHPWTENTAVHEIVQALAEGVKESELGNSDGLLPLVRVLDDQLNRRSGLAALQAIAEAANKQKNVRLIEKVSGSLVDLREQAARPEAQRLITAIANAARDHAGSSAASRFGKTVAALMPYVDSPVAQEAIRAAVAAATHWQDPENTKTLASLLAGAHAHFGLEALQEMARLTAKAMIDGQYQEEPALQLIASLPELVRQTESPLVDKALLTIASLVDQRQLGDQEQPLVAKLVEILPEYSAHLGRANEPWGAAALIAKFMALRGDSTVLESLVSLGEKAASQPRPLSSDQASVLQVAIRAVAIHGKGADYKKAAHWISMVPWSMDDDDALETLGAWLRGIRDGRGHPNDLWPVIELTPQIVQGARESGTVRTLLQDLMAVTAEKGSSSQMSRHHELLLNSFEAWTQQLDGNEAYAGFLITDFLVNHAGSALWTRIFDALPKLYPHVNDLNRKSFLRIVTTIAQRAPAGAVEAFEVRLKALLPFEHLAEGQEIIAQTAAVGLGRLYDSRPEGRAAFGRFMEEFVFAEGRAGWYPKGIRVNRPRWARGEQKILNENMSTLAKLMADPLAMGRYLFMLSVLRHLYPFDSTKMEPYAPIEYAQKSGIEFQFGEFKIVPLSESFRRHVLYRELPDGSLYAVELKIPGEMEDKDVVWENHFDFPQMVNARRPQEPKMPKPIFFMKLFGFFPMYGRRMDFRKQYLGIAAFKYEDRKRFRNVTDDYVNRISQNTGKSVEEIQLAKRVDAVVGSLDVHDSGLRGSTEAGRDMHEENDALYVNGTGGLVADTGAFEKVGNALTVEQRKLETRELLGLKDGERVAPSDIAPVVESYARYTPSVAARAGMAVTAITELDYERTYAGVVHVLGAVHSGQPAPVEPPLSEIERQVLDIVIHPPSGGITSNTRAPPGSRAGRLRGKSRTTAPRANMSFLKPWRDRGGWRARAADGAETAMLVVSWGGWLTATLVVVSFFGPDSARLILGSSVGTGLLVIPRVMAYLHYTSDESTVTVIDEDGNPKDVPFDMEDHYVPLWIAFTGFSAPILAAFFLTFTTLPLGIMAAGVLALIALSHTLHIYGWNEGVVYWFKGTPKAEIKRSGARIPFTLSETQRLSLKKGLEAALEDEKFSAETLVGELEKIPFMKEQYRQSAHIDEGYSIRKHTLMTMSQREKYFREHPYRRILRAALALHDTGKDLAYQEGGSLRRQHEKTLEIIDTLAPALPMNADELRLIRGLIDGDPIGQFIQGQIVLEVAVGEVQRMAQIAAMPPIEFLPLLMVFYQCDLGAYTKDAGAIGRLDHRFESDAILGWLTFDPELRRLRFGKLEEQLIDRLAKAIENPSLLTDPASLATDPESRALWKVWSENILPMWFYHSSSVKSLPSIKEYGLDPGRKPFKIADFERIAMLYRKATLREYNLEFKATSGAIRRNNATTDIRVAWDSYAKQGPEVLRHMADHIEALLADDANRRRLDQPEIDELNEMRSSAAAWLEEHRPVLLAFQLQDLPPSDRPRGLQTFEAFIEAYHRSGFPLNAYVQLMSSVLQKYFLDHEFGTMPPERLRVVLESMDPARKHLPDLPTFVPLLNVTLPSAPGIPSDPAAAQQLQSLGTLLNELMERYALFHSEAVAWLRDAFLTYQQLLGQMKERQDPAVVATAATDLINKITEEEPEFRERIRKRIYVLRSEADAQVAIDLWTNDDIATLRRQEKELLPQQRTALQAILIGRTLEQSIDALETSDSQLFIDLRRARDTQDDELFETLERKINDFAIEFTRLKNAVKQAKGTPTAVEAEDPLPSAGAIDQMDWNKNPFGIFGLPTSFLGRYEALEDARRVVHLRWRRLLRQLNLSGETPEAVQQAIQAARTKAKQRMISREEVANDPEIRKASERISKINLALENINTRIDWLQRLRGRSGNPGQKVSKFGSVMAGGLAAGIALAVALTFPMMAPLMPMVAFWTVLGITALLSAGASAVFIGPVVRIWFAKWMAKRGFSTAPPEKVRFTEKDFRRFVLQQGFIPVAAKDSNAVDMMESDVSANILTYNPEILSYLHATTVKSLVLFHEARHFRPIQIARSKTLWGRRINEFVTYLYYGLVAPALTATGALLGNRIRLYQPRLPGSVRGLDTESLGGDLYPIRIGPLIELDSKKPGQKKFMPSQIGSYKILGELGSGGIGEVYRARDMENQQEEILVAVKTVRPSLAAEQREDKKDNIRRFLLGEAAALRKLSASSKFPTLYSVLRDEDGEYYLVMELLSGRTLDQYPEGRPFSPDDLQARTDDALDMADKILEALEEQELAEIVHGDIKPSNVIYAPAKDDPSQTAIKVIDFGAAFGAELAGESIGGESISGSTGYAAPEHFSPSTRPKTVTSIVGMRRIPGDSIDDSMSAIEVEPSIQPLEYRWPDRRTDIHAVGVTLYELIRGSVSDKSNLREIVVNDQGLREDVRSIILRAISQEPIDRYHYASDMRRDLREARGAAMRIHESGLTSVSGVVRVKAVPLGRVDSSYQTTASLTIHDPARNYEKALRRRALHGANSFGWLIQRLFSWVAGEWTGLMAGFAAAVTLVPIFESGIFMDKLASLGQSLASFGPHSGLSVILALAAAALFYRIHPKEIRTDPANRNAILAMTFLTFVAAFLVSDPSTFRWAAEHHVAGWLTFIHALINGWANRKALADLASAANRARLTVSGSAPALDGEFLNVSLPADIRGPVESERKTMISPLNAALGFSA